MEHAWIYLLCEWLPPSSHQLDTRPFFEHYPASNCYDPDTGALECEICIPVIPL